MDRKKILKQVKKNLLREFKSNKYHLERVIPYYFLIKEENHPLLLELIKETNNNNFYIDYRYDNENCYSYGKMYIRFGLTEKQACGLEEYPIERYLQKDETYFEIDLEWYKHGSVDEYVPRIIVRKCIESKFLDCHSDTSKKYEKWVSKYVES